MDKVEKEPSMHPEPAERDAQKSRRTQVEEAVARNDWAALRELSLLPGGFDGARTEAWSFLLHVPPLEPAGDDDRDGTVLSAREPRRSRSAAVAPPGAEAEVPFSLSERSLEHPDERQVGLDTDRSFVLYPVEEKDEKDRLKTRLHDVIVHVLRKRPKLGYFQGYHDIISVLMLTMAPSENDDLERVGFAAEKLSLHRLRDAMGQGLEPLLGMLRLMKRLLRTVDPEYANMLKGAGPLPYYALSSVITAFSHDVPTLPLIQQIFDYVLARPPIVLIYLTAAILLCRKDEVSKLFLTDDQGMLHMVLSTLPTFEDELVTPPRRANSDRSAAHSTAGSSISMVNSDPLSGHGQGTPEGWTEASGDSDPGVPKDMSASWTAPSDFQTSPGTSPNLAPLSTVSASDPSILVLPEPEAASITSSEALSLPHAPPKKIRLSELLAQSDALMRRYPPSSLRPEEIMGPQSVIFTWNEVGDEEDDEAERMVGRPEMVVRPFLDEDEQEEIRSREKEKEERSRRGRRGNGKKKHQWTKNQEIIVLAGVVVAVGIAVAVYQNQRGAHGGVLQKAGDQWRKASAAWFGRGKPAL